MTIEEPKMTSLPIVLWAPRSDRIYVTIELSDVEDEKVKFLEKKLIFSGKGGADKKEYAFDLDLYGEIDPEKSKYIKNNMHLLLQLWRKEEGEFWPRLINKGKLHFVKTDFKKWIDEDEEDEEPEMDMSGAMGGMGGGGMPGMGGMGGMGGDGGMGGMDMASMMAQMGGGAGAGAGGMGGMPGMEGMDMSKMAELQKLMGQMKAEGGEDGEGTPDFSKYMDSAGAGASVEEDDDDDELPPLE